MGGTYQTINEERGARRAAELRKRFKNVSQQSARGSGFGWPNSTGSKGSNGLGSRREYLYAFLSWVAMAAVIVLFGVVLF